MARKKKTISESDFIAECKTVIVAAWSGKVDKAIEMYESEENYDLFESHWFWKMAVKWSIHRTIVLFVIMASVMVLFVMFKGPFALFEALNGLLFKIATVL